MSWRISSAARDVGASDMKSRRRRTARQTAVVVVHEAGVGRADPQVPAAGGHELVADRHVGGLAHLVHHEARLEGRHLAPQRAGRLAVVALHPRQQVGRRLDPERVLGIERRIEQLAHRLRRSHGAQPPVERALDEAIAVLDRRGLGHHRQDRDVRQQEEVEDVVRGPGPEVDQHHVDVERPHLVHHANLLQVLDVRRGQEVGGPADHAQPGRLRVREHLVDRRDPALDEVAERALRLRQPQARVEVRAAEVGVHQHDPASHARELPPDRGRQQGFADPALAAADRPDLPARRAGRRAWQDFGHAQGHFKLSTTRSEQFACRFVLFPTGAAASVASSRSPVLDVALKPVGVLKFRVWTALQCPSVRGETTSFSPAPRATGMSSTAARITA